VSAAHALHAAAHAALANVSINAAALKDEAVAGELRSEVDALGVRADELAAAAREAFTARIA
jgi:formiminotetrahydrofolate cyclodeaminase